MSGVESGLEYSLPWLSHWGTMSWQWLDSCPQEQCSGPVVFSKWQGTLVSVPSHCAQGCECLSMANPWVLYQFLLASLHPTSMLENSLVLTSSPSRMGGTCCTLTDKQGLESAQSWELVELVEPPQE